MRVGRLLRSAPSLWAAALGHRALGLVPAASEPPVLFLGGRVPDRLTPIAEALEWRTGVLLSTDPSTTLTDALDAATVDFAHIVAHAEGAHAALRLGASVGDRVGCVVLLDTPLLAPADALNHALDADLEMARRDPNRSPEEIAALEAQRRSVPSHPLDPDANPDAVALQVDVGEASLLQHPMFILRPRAGARMDDETLRVHREVFNVKEDVVLDACPSHEALLDPSHAAAVGSAIRCLLLRYSTQHDVETRLEHWRQLDAERMRAARESGERKAAGAVAAQARAESETFDNKPVKKAAKVKKTKKAGKPGKPGQQKTAEKPERQKNAEKPEKAEQAPTKAPKKGKDGAPAP